MQSIKHYCWKLELFLNYYELLNQTDLAQWAGAVVYTDRISAKGKTPLPTSVLDMTLTIWWRGARLEDLGNVVYPFIATLARNGSTW